MRVIFTIIAIFILACFGWYAWRNNSSFSNVVDNRLSSSEFHTLEVRYTAEEIMQAQKANLLKKPGYNYLEPKLVYYPYLLMDVKYSNGKEETGEGILLWSLNDGEMVMDTSTWETTHGYEDCLAAKADRNDFKIIQALAQNGLSLEREKLYRQWNIDQENVDKWINNCKEKKLIASNGNRLRLHVQNPRLTVNPVTHLDQPLVTQPAKIAQKMRGEYPALQIKTLVQTAFGEDFAIRKMEEVFLPVYAIPIQNPDGSVLTTYWNALNGKKFDR